MDSFTGPLVGLKSTGPTPIDGLNRSRAMSVPHDSLESVEAVAEPRQSPDYGRESLRLETRPVRMTDLAALRRIDVVYRLNQPETQLVPYSPLRAGAAAAAPLLRAQRSFFVARAGERLVGFAHFRSEAPDQRWYLLAVGASVGVYDAAPVLESLLTHGIQSAGLAGVKRLYARAPEDSAIAAALHAIAWSPYATETVFAGHELGPRRRHSARAQESSDTWAIHQLYNAAVPRDVQYAEAYTSHRWDLRSTWSPAGCAVSGWLIEDGHQLVGYARTATRGESRMVEIVFHPERADVLPELIDASLSGQAKSGPSRVYCSVRGYQAELATALGRRGFVAVQEQNLHVKYTTATVRAPAGEPVPFHVDVRDKLPNRMPTFLQGQPHDESVT